MTFSSLHMMIAVTSHSPKLTRLLLQAAAGCDPRLAGHLTASAFLRFRRSASGSVSAAAMHEYLARRTAMLELVRLPEAGRCLLMLTLRSPVVWLVFWQQVHGPR